MKRFYSTLLVALVTAFGFLSYAGNPSWEVVAGMNVAKLNVSGASSRIGFHAGIRATYDIQSADQGFYVNAAALLSLKGCKAEGVKLNPYYLDIPVHAGYKYEVNESVALFSEFGPYFGIGLFGKTGGENVFGDGGFKRFDFGLGLRVGIEICDKVPVSLGYDFGMLDVFDGVSAETRNLTVSVGYKF